MNWGTCNSNSQPMPFVTLEDENDIVESVWFSDAHQRFGAAMEHSEPFRVIGRVQVDHGVALLQVERTQVIDTISTQAAPHTHADATHANSRIIVDDAAR